MSPSTPIKFCFRTGLLWAVFICGAAISAAQTVLIDWSTAATVGNPAGDGKYWNSLGAPVTGGTLTATALIDVANAASGISVAVHNTGNASSSTGAGFGGTGIAGPTGADPFDEAAAVSDGIFVNSNSVGTSVITFTGLGNAVTYDFTAIGGRASNGNNGVIKVMTGSGSGSGTYSLLNSGALLNFSVTSSPSGVIVLDFSEGLNDTNGTTNSTWNALRLAPADGSPPVVDPPPAATERLRIGQWIRPASPASVIEQPGWHVWGGNVVEENGQYHMFYARWPVAGYAWGDGWLFASEIWHAVADAPAGPFTPTQLVLGGREGPPDDAFWDSRAPHNPHIRKFDGKLYLYYTATRDPGEAAWPGVSQRNRLQRSQRIGVIAGNSVQDLLDGNFTRPADPLLVPVTGNSAADDISTNPNPSAIPANRITNNPSVIKRPDGKFQMIYKTNWPQAPGFAFGQALADSPTGPFTYVPGALLNDGGQYEDQFHWYDPVLDQYNLIIKRFGTGLDQFVSADSNTWTLLGRQSDISVFRSDGSFESLDLMERPQILLGPDGRPQALYAAIRESLGGGAYLSYNMQVPLSNPTASATVMTGESDILTSGLPITAVNLGTATPLTLNGLEFSAAGLDPAALATEYGFTQAGGAATATLDTALVDAIYDGIPAFEGFLDSIAFQTQATQANATLSFPLTGLARGRTYRLQLFLGETRAAFPRHGPQLLEIGGTTRIRFDLGPGSSLVTSGATAIRLTATFTADAPDTTVSLRNATSGGGGLQLAAFALHDVSMPTRSEIALSPGVAAELTFHDLVPGFTYRVRRSTDLSAWSDAPEPNLFEPVGTGLSDAIYSDPAPPANRAFYQLQRD